MRIRSLTAILVLCSLTGLGCNADTVTVAEPDPIREQGDASAPDAPLDFADAQPADAAVTDAGQSGADSDIADAATQPPSDTGPVTADAATTPDAGTATADAGPPTAWPLDAVDALTVYLNLGDSVGEGFNADRGRGYAALLARNHSAYPTYAADNVGALFTDARLTNRADSGDTSRDVVGQVRRLPNARGGDVLVTIYVGGNDFNDNIQTMISQAATDAAIREWQSNMTSVLRRLRAEYDAPADGQTLIVALATIHDPTGGTGDIPSTFRDGFCGTLNDPRFLPALRARAIANLGRFNDAIRDFAAANGAVLVDSEALFIAHGMNATGSDRWIDDDCAHFTNRGHHELRREIWRLLTGRLR